MFHTGALMIFPLVGISTNNVVLTRTLPFDTHFYYLMGLNEIIISKNIPERRTLLAVGREALTQTYRIRDDYENEWETNKIYYENAEEAFKIIYGKNGIEFKNFENLIKETKYIFCNLQPKLDFKKVEEIFSRNRGALKEKVKFIGGIIATEPAPIKPETEELLELAEASIKKESQGIIIVCFGTLISTKKMSVVLFKKYLKVFKSFKNYSFIWKFDYDDDEDQKEKFVSQKMLKSKKD
uniref:glucuronosyltransferase n=1 Tax=Meloidogyne enterolobii TaxID=390850 RepID=A0A6V7UBY7_MELEN|nr:unnamed protein product [Meloidogyne enterolobii]